ncbi:MAG: dihydroxy-acid dehydratase, partial [Chloroflexi bacterium]|nr:dihydroxy-acid dehydratase [Chloroflexota bacterium]
MALFMFLRRLASVVYLMTHPDVPLRLKTLPVLALAYLVFPKDLFFDFRAFGLIDDLIVVTVLLGIFTSRGWYHIERAKKGKDDAIPTAFEVVEPDAEPESGAEPEPGAARVWRRRRGAAAGWRHPRLSARRAPWPRRARDYNPPTHRPSQGAPSMATNPLKKHSAEMTDGPSRAPARAMLKAIGFTDEDLAKPLIGVATTWIETMPCNFNQRELATYVKEGIREAGGTPMEFNTIAVSDGVAMGTEGMKGSLVSREVIADSIEVVARGHSFDGLVVLVGCDKTIPGGAMALARLNLPGLAIYNGSIAPGKLDGVDLTILDVFEAVGAHGAGKIDDARLKAIEDAACPGAGACGGQFTANTMAMALEFLGLSPAGANAVPALGKAKAEAAREAGRLAVQLLRDDVKPRDILTREAFENAIAGVAATGGSTNAVLHLLAIAREAGVELDIDDFDTISSRTPIVANLKPAGDYVAEDLYNAGGYGLVAKELVGAGLAHAGARNVDGGTFGTIAEAAVATAGQQVVVSMERPLKATGGIAIMRGNLATDGCVVKLAGHERSL